MAESPHLRIRQTRQQRDDVIHQVLVVDDRVLALFHQGLNEVAKVAAELFPLWARHDHRVLATFLSTITMSQDFVIHAHPFNKASKSLSMTLKLVFKLGN